jgi:hypothetical protein
VIEFLISFPGIKSFTDIFYDTREITLDTYSGELMNAFGKKYGLIATALGVSVILLVARFIIDALNYDVISINTVIGSFVGAAIFTIAIILAGTLTDFKESEKIPGDLAAAIKNLYHDSRLIQLDDKEPVFVLQRHVRKLVAVINENFRNNTWNLRRDIIPAMDAINDDLARLAELNVPPNFLVKLRSELSAVDRLANRIEIIMETSFIPAAYAIAELATAGVIFILLFIKLDPYFEGLVIFTVISALLISLLLLIRDMDNPFEVGRTSYADVDMRLLWQLEEYLEER